MAKIRSDYENGLFSRFLTWLKSGSTRLDDAMSHTMDDQAALTRAQAQQIAQEREMDYEARRAQMAEREKSMYAHVHTWALTKGKRVSNWLYRIAAVVICVSIIVLLVSTAAELPPYGSPDNPAHNEVSERYIEQGMQETGAVNIVAGMILDYRAFDTLGESNVLFIAAVTVLTLLRVTPSHGGKPSTSQLEAECDDRMYEPKNDMILQYQVNFLVPMILLFGIYGLMNGHIGPGGGFGGGAIMGAALILYLNAFGFKKTQRFFTYKTFTIVSVAALSFYACSKAYSFFTGANHLPSFITPGTPGMLFSAGLIPYLNIAVGMVVCCTMYAFYTLFRKGDL